MIVRVLSRLCPNGLDQLPFLSYITTDLIEYFYNTFVLPSLLEIMDWGIVILEEVTPIKTERLKGIIQKGCVFIAVYLAL